MTDNYYVLLWHMHVCVLHVYVCKIIITLVLECDQLLCLVLNIDWYYCFFLYTLNLCPQYVTAQAISGTGALRLCGDFLVSLTNSLNWL